MTRFGGRSFWCALVEDIWYVGAWGSHVYQLSNADDMLAFAQAFLTDSHHMADFSPELKENFALVPIKNEETRRILPDGRPEHD